MLATKPTTRQLKSLLLAISKIWDRSLITNMGYFEEQYRLKLSHKVREAIK